MERRKRRKRETTNLIGTEAKRHLDGVGRGILGMPAVFYSFLLPPSPTHTPKKAAASSSLKNFPPKGETTGRRRRKRRRAKGKEAFFVLGCIWCKQTGPEKKRRRRKGFLWRCLKLVRALISFALSLLLLLLVWK